MEKVFLLMWLADVITNLGFVAFMALAVALVATGFAAMCEAFEERAGALRFFRVIRWLAIPVVISVVLPSSATIKLMALASAGETATETQLGQKGVEALNAVLDKIISESKKK